MKKKSVVLLSGGLDSSVNLFAAVKDSEVLLALFFNYGQKAFSKELEAARALTYQLNLKIKLIELPWLTEITKTSLVAADSEIPCGQDVQIDDQATSLNTAKAVWVPNRNGVFLNIGAAVAEALGASEVVVGFNAEEAKTFPDNSGEYLESLNQAFKFSTANQVTVKSYTLNMFKTEIVLLGKKLNVPFQKLWPCYLSGEKICGQCESCQRFKRAISQAGVTYEV